MMETLAADLGRRITLVLEPGRSLVAESGFLLTRVVGVDRRAAGGQVAGVDTTTSHVSSETYRVYGGYRRIVLASRSSNDDAVPTDVVGCTTFSGDYIGRAARDVIARKSRAVDHVRRNRIVVAAAAGEHNPA